MNTWHIFFIFLWQSVYILYLNQIKRTKSKLLNSIKNQYKLNQNIYVIHPKRVSESKVVLFRYRNFSTLYPRSKEIERELHLESWACYLIWRRPLLWNGGSKQESKQPQPWPPNDPTKWLASPLSESCLVWTPLKWPQKALYKERERKSLRDFEKYNCIGRYIYRERKEEGNICWCLRLDFVYNKARPTAWGRQLSACKKNLSFNCSHGLYVLYYLTIYFRILHINYKLIGFGTWRSRHFPLCPMTWHDRHHTYPNVLLRVKIVPTDQREILITCFLGKILACHPNIKLPRVTHA